MRGPLARRVGLTPFRWHGRVLGRTSHKRSLVLAHSGFPLHPSRDWKSSTLLLRAIRYVPLPCRNGIDVSSAFTHFFAGNLSKGAP